MYRRNHSQCIVCEKWNHEDDMRDCDRCEEPVCDNCFVGEEDICENCAWVRLEESLNYHINSKYYRSDGRDFTEQDFVKFARQHYTIREIFGDPITDTQIIKAFIKDHPKPPENKNAIIGKIVWG